MMSKNAITHGFLAVIIIVLCFTNWKSCNRANKIEKDAIAKQDSIFEANRLGIEHDKAYIDSVEAEIEELNIKLLSMERKLIESDSIKTNIKATYEIRYSVIDTLGINGLRNFFAADLAEDN